MARISPRSINRRRCIGNCCSLSRPAHTRCHTPNLPTHARPYRQGQNTTKVPRCATHNKHSKHNVRYIQVSGRRRWLRTKKHVFPRTTSQTLSIQANVRACELTSKLAYQPAKATKPKPESLEVLFDLSQDHCCCTPCCQMNIDIQPRHSKLFFIVVCLNAGETRRHPQQADPAEMKQFVCLVHAVRVTPKYEMVKN